MRRQRPRPALSRRSFLERSSALAVALGAAPNAASAGAEPDSRPRAKVIDCHNHLNHRSIPTWESDDRRTIETCERLGIDQICCSVLTPRRPATAEGFRECNAWLLDSMKRYPGRVLGYCYVNPGCKTEALEEIRRRVQDDGFIGIKLYNEYFCTDPVVFPVVELAIELGVPILHHAGHPHYFLKQQPYISDGARLAELARRYPEARLICAHVCGGGDWEWTIRALRHAPTVYLDTSGSVADEGVVETAARALGVDRLLFGCDLSLVEGVARIRGADLSDADRAKILGGNMAKILESRRS